MLIQIISNGLMLSSIYILFALGLVMIFSILGVMNFAHGEFYMLGGFCCYIFFMQYQINYFVVLLISVTILLLLGIIIEKLLFKPIRNQHVNQLVVALGLSIIFMNLAAIYFGPDNRNVASIFKGVLDVGQSSLSLERLVVLIIAAGFFSILYLFLTYTKVGLAIRAFSQNKEAAALQGINGSSISSLTFGVGCALAGVAGVMIAPVFYVSPYIGMAPLMKAFAVIVLGGIGSITGAIIGGLIIGMTEAFALTYFGKFAHMLSFIIMIVILIIKPTGLFGHEA